MAAPFTAGVLDKDRGAVAPTAPAKTSDVTATTLAACIRVVQIARWHNIASPKRSLGQPIQTVNSLAVRWTFPS
jgi:hypothetical protein